MAPSLDEVANTLPMDQALARFFDLLTDIQNINFEKFEKCKATVRRINDDANHPVEGGLAFAMQMRQTLRDSMVELKTMRRIWNSGQNIRLTNVWHQIKQRRQEEKIQSAEGDDQAARRDNVIHRIDSIFNEINQRQNSIGELLSSLLHKHNVLNAHIRQYKQ